jgi:Tannase and feruloyl esterase
MTSFSERSWKRSLRDSAVSAAVLLSSIAVVPFVVASPASAWEHAPMHCSSLAAFVAQQAGKQLNKNPVNPGASTSISAATPVTAAIIPASSPDLSYCQVVFQLEPAMTIEVGLPLNTADGGTGGVAGGCGVTTVVNNNCVQGNWNGKIEALGNGGYSGGVPGVTSATDVGFVGSSTDNGHSANWCNAIDPETGQTNAQPNCGAVGGGGFELDPKNNLITEQVSDFIDTSEVEQTTWAVQLAQVYYGERPKRTYWNGCSTGGRQGMQMAQFHPEMFDGILAGAPAFNWNRFIPGSIWFPVVLADVDPADCPGGTAASCNPSNPFNGSSVAFQNAYTAANAAAVAACDGDDGVQDGVINEPRRCHYDARSLIGQTPAPMTSPMTEAQAQAIDMIWDGPRNQRGQRLWGGITRGTTFGVELGYGLLLNASWPLYWLEQNPSFNITGNITTTNFSSFFQASDRKFADTVPPPPGFVVPAATDSIDLNGLIRSRTKLIHYRGLNDPLIIPFGSWNYDTRLFEEYGVDGTKQFYRSFYYPGNGHCGGNTAGLFGGGNFPNAGLINSNDLFNSLIDWVENGSAPDSVVAYTLPNDAGNTTLICAAPNQTVYRGGPITSSSSYTCTNYKQQPPDLAGYDQTAKQYYEAP